VRSSTGLSSFTTSRFSTYYQKFSSPAFRRALKFPFRSSQECKCASRFVSFFPKMISKYWLEAFFTVALGRLELWSQNCFGMSLFLAVLSSSWLAKYLQYLNLIDSTSYFINWVFVNFILIILCLIWSGLYQNIVCWWADKNRYSRDEWFLLFEYFWEAAGNFFSFQTNF